MPRFTVTLPKGSRLDGLEKFLKDKYPGVNVYVKRDDPPESRSDRLDQAMSLVEDAKSEVEELQNELQEWRDNLPENLQSGGKADELEEATSALESLADELSTAIDSAGNVSFPSMF